MVKAKQGSCCICCTTCIILALVGLGIWLAIMPRTPVCSIEEFSFFALQQTTTNISTHTNNTIRYDLKVKNKNADDVGIYYDALNVTFYYKRNLNSFPIQIGNTTFSPFYLRKLRSTHRVGSIEARGVRLENATMSPVMFRVELLTVLRYKKPFWKSRRYQMLIGANLEVNGEGSLVNKGVKLRSKAGRNNKVHFELMGILFFILTL